MAGIPPMLPPPPPARKRSMNALTASLPPLPKTPRLDVPTTSRRSSERSADHSDDRHYEESRGGNGSPSTHSPERTDLENRQAPGPNQKAVYCAAFKLHFGVPSDGEPYFADFCAIQTGISTGRTACDPVEEVKKYAVRVSGKHAKDPRKMDLHANIRDTLIKCFLDGLKMGQPELDRMPDELAAQPTQFWLDLGPTNESRAAKLFERQATRDAWTSALKSALGRALNNVRQYVKKGNALVPKKKSRNAND